MLITVPTRPETRHRRVVLSIDPATPLAKKKYALGYDGKHALITGACTPVAILFVVGAVHTGYALYYAAAAVCLVIAALCGAASGVIAHHRAMNYVNKTKKLRSTVDLSPGGENHEFMHMLAKSLANQFPSPWGPERSFETIASDQEAFARGVLLDPKALAAARLLVRERDNPELLRTSRDDLSLSIWKAYKAAKNAAALERGAVNKEVYGITGLDPYRFERRNEVDDEH